MRLKSPLFAALAALCIGLLGCQKKDEKSAKKESPSERPTPAGNTTTLGGATNPEAKAVRKTFDDYKKAILAKDGDTAAALIDKETVDFYDKMLKLALTAPAAEVKKQSVVGRILILQMRHNIPLPELKTMTATKLIGYGIDKGWIGENVKRVNIGEITIAGDRASGPGKVRNRTVPFTWRLRKEGGAWKLNLTTLFPLAEVAMKRAATRSKMSVDELILSAINMKSETGKKATEAIWDAPK